MKIYIQQDNQKVGPFTKEELQAKIYGGELVRTVSACIENGSEWVPLESLLNQNQTPGSAAASRLTINLDQLKDPKEKTALIWLYIASVPTWIVLLIWTVASMGIALLLIGILELFHIIGQMWFAAHVKTNAVRVSETQLPEVHRIVLASCEKLGMKVPDVYVMQQNVWNAFATKIFGRRMVVLLSGAVDSILLKGDMEQLSWLVGHELGHHWAGHLNMSQKLAKFGGWLIWVNLWHSRRAEFTCDRVGMYCAGSLKASQLALVNATVGAQLASRVNIGEAMNQWQEHRGEFFVRYRTLYSTHPHLLARLDYLNNTASEFGLSR
jgi:Zn-dependent protease with chaperone function